MYEIHHCWYGWLVHFALSCNILLWEYNIHSTGHRAVFFVGYYKHAAMNVHTFMWARMFFGYKLRICTCILFPRCTHGGIKKKLLLGLKYFFMFIDHWSVIFYKESFKNLALFYWVMCHCTDSWNFVQWRIRQFCILFSVFSICGWKRVINFNMVIFISLSFYGLFFLYLA